MSTCIHFATRDDGHAQKVAAVLEGLGYETRRDLETFDADVFAAAAAAAARRYRLTERERQILDGLLRGYNRAQIAERLEVSHPRIKWHRHNVYSKLGVSNAEAALRKALFLDDPRWLSAPLSHRDSLERLAGAAGQVVRVSKTDGRSRLDLAIARLEHELAEIRRDACLPAGDVEGQPAAVAAPDNQLALPTGDDSTPDTN